MRTVVANLREMAEEIEKLLEDLLLNHSSIYDMSEPGEGFVIVSQYGHYAYQDMGDSGRQVQSRVLDDYRHFYALLSVLLSGQPKDTLEKLSEADDVVIRTIEQQSTWEKETHTALSKAVTALQSQVDLLKHLYNFSAGECIYVPDTNALLYNPAIESWTFGSQEILRLILVPTVLSELDSLKINHRNETVRQKAELLIRKIKEYRRRGNLTKGVPIVTGRTELLAVATEPRMDKSLPWLDPQNNDDRFLAAVLEVMRTCPWSPVTVVTRDINLQNKAEFARIPFVEPPEQL